MRWIDQMYREKVIGNYLKQGFFRYTFRYILRSNRIDPKIIANSY
jgi:hypothetical protein